MTDRTVHGLTEDGAPVVRYDRSGKWYVEPHSARRRRLTVMEAASLVAKGDHYPRRAGGQALDAKVRRILDEKEDN